MISDIFVFLILLVALTIGWVIGRNQSRNNVKAQYLDSDYFVGLNYLLDDQPDKAVSALVDSLEVNSDTIEVHLAIARIFRKQGEIEKAIQVHQNLFARPGLDKSYGVKIQFELAKDYYSAGIYERAEHLLLELTLNSEFHRLDSYNLLVEIYIQEQDWPKAIVAAEHLTRKEQATKEIDLSHFYCSLAQEQTDCEDYISAKKSLKRALQLDKDCSRALWLLGNIEYIAKNYKESIKLIKRAVLLNHNIVIEVLKMLHECFKETKNLQSWIQFLEQIYEIKPNTDVLILIVQYYQDAEGETKAYDMLYRYLGSEISVKGMHYLYSHFHRNLLPERFDRHFYDTLFESLLDNQNKYDCFKCGYQTNNYYWLCPSCKTWSSFQLKNDQR